MVRKGLHINDHSLNVVRQGQNHAAPSSRTLEVVFYAISTAPREGAAPKPSPQNGKRMAAETMCSSPCSESHPPWLVLAYGENEKFIVYKNAGLN